MGFLNQQSFSAHNLDALSGFAIEWCLFRGVGIWDLIMGSKGFIWIYDVVLDVWLWWTGGGSSWVVVWDIFAGGFVGGLFVIVLKMRSDSRSRSRSRSRSPRGRKIRTERNSYRDAPYRRESRRGFSPNNLCKNCKRPGHFARDCPNVAICHNCGLPGHIASECTTKSLCWNCREPGHMAGNCPNEGICHTCGKSGHRARDCTAPPVPPGDLKLCNNCFKQGHFASDCTNEKACKNCRKTGHLARDCQNDPVCNLCNISGHMARDCPKGGGFDERGAGPRAFGGGGGPGGFREIVCRTCQQVGHMSRDCMALMICHNCGGRGHQAYECPSGRFMDRFPRRY